MRRSAGVLAIALLVAACAGGGDDDAATSTTRAPTTTTAPDPDIAAGAFPLTGTPANGSPNATRVALAVKYDNAPKARMQHGLNRADVIYEEKVEDGVTRFLALFHSTDADPIGPVRSARTTDIALAVPLRRPLFAYSGTNTTFQRAIDAAPLVDLSFDKVNVYYRERSRPAPYNIYASTKALFGLAPQGSTSPPPLFAYRVAGRPFTGAGVAAATGVDLTYAGENITTRVDWTWDSRLGAFVRKTDGQQHVDAIDNQPVTATSLIIQIVDYVDTGERDTSGAVVPEGKLVGEGEAWVLSDGKVVKGRWSKSSMEAVTRYTDSEGNVIRITPGRTWIELPPPGGAVLR